MITFQLISERSKKVYLTDVHCNDEEFYNFLDKQEFCTEIDNIETNIGVLDFSGDEVGREYRLGYSSYEVPEIMFKEVFDRLVKIIGQDFKLSNYRISKIR